MHGVRVRWAPLGRGDRRRAANALVRDMTGAALRHGPCVHCGGAHGVPRLDGGVDAVSLAYTASHVFAAVGAGVHALGIDAECGDPADAAGVERLRAGATLRDWTRLEAVAKADGRGLALDVATVRIESDAGARWTARVPGAPHPFSGADLIGPAGVVLSVARAAAPAGQADPATR
ncbi:chemotaxis protein CheY [Microbacterium sp. NPDC089189]|uniref:chemotaxis protein CheY n=1 Tax=Microbacterium sp. NPDC089189 TaxID=3154972 RepID=UPI00344AD1CD